MSVGDSCPAPVVVYNMVPVTGIDLSVETLTKMASHPNIVGVKDKDVSVFKRFSSISLLFFHSRRCSRWENSRRWSGKRETGTSKWSPVRPAICWPPCSSVTTIERNRTPCVYEEWRLNDILSVTSSYSWTVDPPQRIFHRSKQYSSNIVLLLSSDSTLGNKILKNFKSFSQ